MKKEYIKRGAAWILAAEVKSSSRFLSRFGLVWDKDKTWQSYPECCHGLHHRE